MTELQDVRIRGVSVILVRRLKAVLAGRGQTMIEWFTQSAAQEADAAERAKK